MSSASSCDVNISKEEGEYIEIKSMHNAKHDVIPLQLHNSHQSINIVTHFDKTFLITTAIEGEYIDYKFLIIATEV